MITSFEIALIDGRWHVTAFVDGGGNRKEPLIESSTDARPLATGPLAVGGPTWYLNLSQHWLSVYEYWKCGGNRKELRGLDHHDCGGCETCDQMFGGVRVCANPNCSESKERDKLDPEGESYLQ